MPKPNPLTAPAPKPVTYGHGFPARRPYLGPATREDVERWAERDERRFAGLE